MLLIKKYSLKANQGSRNSFFHFQFPLLSEQDHLSHCVFTRQGGVSGPPFDSLNTGYGNGDRRDNVTRNLDLIRGAVDADNLVFMNQVHGRNIIVLRGDKNPDLGKIADADAAITDIPSTALMVKQADCQGVILYDRTRRVVSVVHCGWRGNAFDILGAVVKKMRSEFGCRESDLMAAIGPSLGPCCAEFTTHREIFPEEFTEFMVRQNYFDLWEVSRKQLLDAGLRGNSIEVAGICTKCNNDLFFSYRAEGKTGRFATIAMLKQS